MSFQEKDMQSLFTKWLKKNGWTAAFELKICKGKSLPFSRIEAHQIQALLDVKHHRLAYKISDQSVGYKPWDCFCMEGEDAYLVVMFYEPRKEKIAYIIDIDRFICYTKESKRKSLTEETARELSHLTIKL